jgi:hypothetical protein
MSLQEAKRQVTHAKIGFFGGTGSGKTTTAAEIALGLSKDYHKGAPVAFFSTEPGVDYVIPMFEREGVKLFTERSKSFKDLLQTARDAVKLGCCALVVDSITHVWVELVDSFCRKKDISKPEFQHWRIIKGEWAEWANVYVNAPLHIIVAGRAGFEYEYEVNEDGKKELVKGDSKMKAEGEFGYEADLLVEMTAHSDKQEQRRARGKKQVAVAPRMLHTALVRKCRVWELNGKQFQWADKDRYEPGDYRLVTTPFKPYLDFLAIGTTSTAPIVDNTRNSDQLFDANGDSEYYNKQREKTIALEDWDATMSLLFPGQTAGEKRIRMLVSQEIFQGVRSRTEIERQQVEILQRGALTLREFENQVKKSEIPGTEEGWMSLLSVAKQVVEEKEQTAAVEAKEYAEANPF